MAIRKPTPKGEKSAAMAELLAQAGQESKFKNGSLVEGTVSAVKGDDVIGVLDIDSPKFSRFNEEDKAGLEEFVRILEREVF